MTHIMTKILIKINLTLSLVAFALTLTAQQAITLEEALLMAFKNNELIQSNEFRVGYFKEMKKTASDMGKFSATWMHGQYNSLYQDNNVTFTQSIPFPTVLGNQLKLGKEQIVGAEKSLLVVKNELGFEVKSSFYQIKYLEAVKLLLQSQDSLFEDFYRASSLRYKSGESNLLEKTTAETQLMEVKNLASINTADIETANVRLQALLKLQVPISIMGLLQKRALPSQLDSLSLAANPQLNYLQQQKVISKQAKLTERSRMLPDLTFGYFNQSLIGIQNVDGQDRSFNAGNRFQGFQLGLSFPLWVAPQVARAKAAAFAELETERNAAYFKTMLGSNFNQAKQELKKYLSSLNYYESSAIKNANLILRQSKKSFSTGEISYIEYLQSIKNALAIKSNYLQALNQYNQTVIKIEFLMGTL
jgi:cobalt-zinc-cadmium resistance protein CzcA